MTLAERLRVQVDGSPEKVCLWLQEAGQPDAGVSYAALWNGSLRYAERFAGEGVKPGDVAILIQQHGVDLVFAFWGAIIAGVVPSIMPFLTEKLSPAQYQADLRALIGITQPAAIVTYAEFESPVRLAVAGTPVRTVISSGAVQTTEAARPWTPATQLRRDSDIALLQHSSGTTGLQKGVALSHAAVMNQLRAYGKSIQFNKSDVIVSWLPLYHDMGLIAGFLLPILEGAQLVLSSPFDWVRGPWRMPQTVSRYRGTLSWLPNFAYNFMADKIRDRHLEGVDLSSWRAVINCSEPVRWESHRDLFERFKGCGLRLGSLQTCYAMAENVFAVTQSELDQEPAVDDIDRSVFETQRRAVAARSPETMLRMLSSGKRIGNTEVRILDEQGEPVPDRVVGEIALRSDYMLTGYYHRPDVDEQALRGGWYLTGDYGYLAAGELYVAGRKKDLIIVGGKNVYPQDLEALSYEIPGVQAGRSVAFGVFNEELGTEDVCMVAESPVVDAAERLRLEEAIRRHVARRSAVTLREVRVVGARWILKTSSGKTARAANRDKFLQEGGEPKPQ